MLLTLNLSLIKWNIGVDLSKDMILIDKIIVEIRVVFKKRNRNRMWNYIKMWNWSLYWKIIKCALCSENENYMWFEE